MAPEHQTKVPMLFWMSQAFQSQFSIDRECLVDKSDIALSHDNLFHSILGMLNIRTVERNSDLDIFASCKTRTKVANK